MISGLFLLATVIRSSKDKARIYKTLALASLFTDLGDKKVVETGKNRRGVMNSKAKDMRRQLGDNTLISNTW